MRDPNLSNELADLADESNPDHEYGVDDAEDGDGDQPEVHFEPPSVRTSPDPDVSDADGDDPENAPSEVGGEPRLMRLCDLTIEYAHWTNPRSITGLDPASIADLADSIKRRTTTNEDGVVAGIKDPLEVVQIRAANGKIVTLAVDGQRRYLAASSIFPDGNVWVPVKDLEPVPVAWTKELADAYLMQVLETVGTRASLSSYEIVSSAMKLRESKDPDTGRVYTLAVISNRVRRSEGWLSKMLRARDTASPKLMLAWQRGEVTDEQFKDLAAAKDPEQQKAATTAVLDARASGDKRAGRTLAKEAKAIAKASQPAPAPRGGKAAKADSKPGKADSASKDAKPGRGDKADAKADKAEPTLKKPSHAVLDDVLATAKQHPPTHDYTKGMVDAIAWVMGTLDPAKFAKAWHKYMEHVAKQKAKRR